MTTSEQFLAVFVQLKALLQPFASQLIVQADGPSGYSLNTPYVPHLKKEIFFGAVQINKKYVSYHLMPVYSCPALLNDMSLALKKRMQGKACFNFTAVDQALFDELARLTERGFEQFKQTYILRGDQR